MALPPSKGSPPTLPSKSKTTISPVLDLRLLLMGSLPAIFSAMSARDFSICSSSTATLSRSSSTVLKSTGSISGRTSTKTVNSSSPPSSNFLISTFGCIAGVKSRSFKALDMASPTAISSTSPRIASPYRCRIIDGGTFPGRKPGIETLPDTSSSLAFIFASTSSAATMILSSWLKPSFFISVTSMALYSPVLHSNRRLSFLNRAAYFSASGAGGGNRTPTDCSTGT